MSLTLSYIYLCILLIVLVITIFIIKIKYHLGCILCVISVLFITAENMRLLTFLYLFLHGFGKANLKLKGQNSLEHISDYFTWR